MPLVSPTHQLQSTECLKVMLSLLSVLWCCWLGDRKGKTEWWGTGMVIYLERGANLHTAQLMPLPLTVSCFSEIQTGFTFLVPAHPGSPGQRAVKRVCVCVTLKYKIFLLCWILIDVYMKCARDRICWMLYTSCYSAMHTLMFGTWKEIQHLLRFSMLMCYWMISFLCLPYRLEKCRQDGTCRRLRARRWIKHLILSCMHGQELNLQPLSLDFNAVTTRHLLLLRFSMYTAYSTHFPGQLGNVRESSGC